MGGRGNIVQEWGIPVVVTSASQCSLWFVAREKNESICGRKCVLCIRRLHKCDPRVVSYNCILLSSNFLHIIVLPTDLSRNDRQGDMHSVRRGPHSPARQLSYTIQQRVELSRGHQWPWHASVADWMDVGKLCNVRSIAKEAEEGDLAYRGRRIYLLTILSYRPPTT